MHPIAVQRVPAVRSMRGGRGGGGESAGGGAVHPRHAGPQQGRPPHRQRGRGRGAGGARHTGAPLHGDLQRPDPADPGGAAAGLPGEV